MRGVGVAAGFRRQVTSHAYLLLPTANCERMQALAYSSMATRYKCGTSSSSAMHDYDNIFGCAELHLTHDICTADV